MVASSNTPFTRASLPRCPLISDELAKKHNVHFEIDTRFRKAARLLQALWLQDHNIEAGIHVRGEGDRNKLEERGIVAFMKLCGYPKEPVAVIDVSTAD
jgi:hypothetical protein